MITSSHPEKLVIEEQNFGRNGWEQTTVFFFFSQTAPAVSSETKESKRTWKIRRSDRESSIQEQGNLREFGRSDSGDASAPERERWFFFRLSVRIVRF